MWHCSPKSRLNNSLLVRCAFWEKFSGANFCFLAFVSGWFFGVVLPMFLLYYVALFSKSHLKNSLLVRCAFWENFRERILVFSLCVRLVFFGVVLPMFLLYYVALFSRRPLDKLSSCQVRVLEEFFGSELLFFDFVSGWCFLVVLCLCFCFTMWPCSPESCPKKFSSCQVRFLEEHLGSKPVFSVCVRLVFFGAVLPDSRARAHGHGDRFGFPPPRPP